MTDEFHKPTQYSGDKFDTYVGGEDPAVILRAAHDTAHALIDHARGTDDPAVVDRLVAYTDQHGVDALAELWARSSPKSLPGALWRIYLIRLLIRQDADATSYNFQRGTEVLGTIDAAVAGAPMPTGPDEITALADEILRGLFRGDFAVALDRASAFCRIMSAGATSIADDLDNVTPERATELTTRALRFTLTGEELAGAARLHRAGTLE
ncbi:MAG: DNA-directed RNA polymerase subunit beta [Microbacteriaceae bacterium]